MKNPCIDLGEQSAWSSNTLMCPRCEAVVINRYGRSEYCKCTARQQKEFVDSLLAAGGVFFDYDEVNKFGRKIWVIPSVGFMEEWNKLARNCKI